MLSAVGSGACMRPEVELEGNGRKKCFNVWQKWAHFFASHVLELKLAIVILALVLVALHLLFCLTHLFLEHVEEGALLQIRRHFFWDTRNSLLSCTKNLVNFLSTLLNKWLTRARNLYDFFSIFLFSAVLNTHRKFFSPLFFFFQLYIFFLLLAFSLALSLSPPPID